MTAAWPSTHPSPAPDVPENRSSTSTSEQTPQHSSHSGHATTTFPPKNCRACSGAQHMIDTFKRLTATGRHSSSHQQLGDGKDGDAARAGVQATVAAAAAAGASALDAGQAAAQQHHNPIDIKQREPESSTAASAQSLHDAVPAPASAGVASSQPTLPCPPETDELGRASWTFLHTMAAYYPDQPTGLQLAHNVLCSAGPQRSLMRSVVEGLAEFYPCSVCAEHLRQQIQDSPPDVTSASALSMWLCKIHNEVNEMLGKPMFDCGRVMERWRDGPADDSCG